MNIKFQTLKFHNFMSFIDAEINFNASGYTLIVGKNNNPKDNALSNGSGKSTIWNALSYCLTGETIQGVSKNLDNVNNPGPMWVELTFNVDNNSFNLTRSHNGASTNLKLIVNGEDKSGKGIRDTEKILNDYIPDLDSSLLGSVIILGQGLPQRFSNNTPSGRKEILEKLSKSDFMIEDIKQKITNRKNYLSSQIRVLEDKFLKASSLKSAYEFQLNDYKNKLVNLGDKNQFDSNIAIYEQELTQLNSNLQAAKEKVSSLELNINELRDKKEKLVESFNAQNQTTNLNYTNDTQNLNNQYNNILHDINYLSNEINRLESIKDVCPTCGQKIPGVLIPDTSALKNKLNVLTESQNKIKAQLSTIKESYNNAIKQDKDKFSFEDDNYKNSIQTLNIQKTELNTSINNLNNQLNESNKKLQQFYNYKENYNSKLQEYGQNIFKLEQSIKELDQEILYATTEKDNLNQNLKVINEINTIATRDFRGYLLINIINYINERIQVYAQDVFNTTINFSLDGNNINITYDNRPIENLSGGEKQKIDLIIQFALRDMLCNFMNFSSNILVIDEGFDFLDNTSCQNILDMISNRLKDIESIFIITHHNSELSIPYDNIINVLKDYNGISSIVR